MLIRSAHFLTSVETLKECPPPDKPEYAFIGRSNVGKSSLLNMLVQQKGLAKTSSTPGKTQTINSFLINEEWYMADLPGYGYARVSKQQREGWSVMLKDYLKNRPNLMCTMVLVDSRLPAQAIDLEFIGWLGQQGLPLCVVLTKADKLGSVKIQEAAALYEEKLRETWEHSPAMFISSAQEGWGRSELLSFIEMYNQHFDPAASMQLWQRVLASPTPVALPAPTARHKTAPPPRRKPKAPVKKAKPGKVAKATAPKKKGSKRPPDAYDPL